MVEPLYKQAVGNQGEMIIYLIFSLLFQIFNSDHPSVASVIKHLAFLYRRQGKYDMAEPLYKQAVGNQGGIIIYLVFSFLFQIFNSDHPSVASVIKHLAFLCRRQGKYDMAEPLYKQAVGNQGGIIIYLVFSFLFQIFNSDHPSVASVIKHLAFLCRRQGKYDMAEPLYKQVVEIREESLFILFSLFQIFNSDHPSVASVIKHLAFLYRRQGKYDMAEPLYKQAMEIREKSLFILFSLYFSRFLTQITQA